ncbi:MAG TPA: NAD(P)/FAD-dependent oxidoreductase [Methylomirabilota bacterium]|nr:NAD(P)/FAD-dependent oxidoreductase [Methylomirabilota bacterium]
MQTKNPHIVVLGGGFGGLAFCQALCRNSARVTVVDRQNHHLFQPLLYQVATAGLSAPEIAQPIRAIVSDHPNVTVRLDEVLDIRLATREVVCRDGTLSYDYLVIGLGGITTYFGRPEWAQFAPGLKSLNDALKIRQKILLAFEKAETETDPVKRQKLMTIVVVGGGPTGVELAGAFAELARHVLRADFRKIDPAHTRIILIEASPVVLSHLPHDLAHSAQRQLEALGVEVRNSTRVTAMSDGVVETTSGRIEAENVVWAAGVGANPLTKQLGVPLDRAGRIIVNADLSLPGYPEVFAIGDNAHVKRENGELVPGVSPAAMQMGKHVAQIVEQESDAPADRIPARPAFSYWDKGTMATIGRRAAVAKIKDLEFSGMLAWLAWLFVHLLFLIGFRNKVAVLLQWAYSYFAYKRGARIITGLSEDVSARQPAPAYKP